MYRHNRIEVLGYTFAHLSYELNIIPCWHYFSNHNYNHHNKSNQRFIDCLVCPKALFCTLHVFLNVILTGALWCRDSCWLRFPAEESKRETKEVAEGHTVVKEQKGRTWAQELLVLSSSSLASALSYLCFSEFHSFLNLCSPERLPFFCKTSSAHVL